MCFFGTHIFLNKNLALIFKNYTQNINNNIRLHFEFFI